jgi:hypothetical protein
MQIKRKKYPNYVTVKFTLEIRFSPLTAFRP